jgi:hypothetical protein
MSKSKTLQHAAKSKKAAATKPAKPLLTAERLGVLAVELGRSLHTSIGTDAWALGVKEPWKYDGRAGLLLSEADALLLLAHLRKDSAHAATS